MSQLGNLNAGSSPVAGGGAGGSRGGLRQIARDFAHHPLAMAGLIVLVLAAVAANALLLEGLLENYLFGVVNLSPLMPSLGLMFGQGGPFINRAPWLAPSPRVVILLLYASLNLVGFGLRGVLLRSPHPEQL